MKPLLGLILLLTWTTQAVAISDSSQKEIDHLLQFIESSHCSFNRNGKIYKGSDAYEHIKTKYDYFNQRGKIQSSEDFIKYSATQSSMSGKRYRVLCGSKGLHSDDWLKQELEIYRKSAN